MLTSARNKVGAYVQLAQADACRFDGARLFRRSKFDRIFISYGLSMIPDWQAALRMSCAHLAPGGQLHVLDFSDQAGWPHWFGNGLNHWLANFHVTPRLDLSRALETVAAETGGHAQCSQLYRGYSQYGIVHLPG
ncbi:class I SAM-dependent methyltransferase [Leisingera sp. JC1]|uniref:class I SAM-dependent methyltransferase n=1 Tax=Leisingera sp. JC1 TaxID=1855282 RepID=UPI0020C7B7F5|nr:class I SAM-dependent methyltransferase [Leisingera sp. JC1]